MKIEKVRICNLASLKGDWIIALDEPCYEESGIFVITGKTGSGKSTILDAICFGLYGLTPRLGDSIDKFITKSCNMGYAEVVFNVRGQIYRSSYKYYKAGKTGKSSKSYSEVHLYNESLNINYIDNPSAGKINHKKIIEKIIGMNFNQFKQSILLAQGEFTNFLLAKSSERAEILERLTDSSIYGKISKQVYEEHKNKKEILSKHKDEIRNLSNDQSLEDQSQLLIVMEQDLLNTQKLLEELQKNLSILKLQEELLISWEKFQQEVPVLTKEIKKISADLSISEEKYNEYNSIYKQFLTRFTEEETRLLKGKELQYEYRLMFENLSQDQRKYEEIQTILIENNNSIKKSQEVYENLTHQYQKLLTKINQKDFNSSIDSFSFKNLELEFKEFKRQYYIWFELYTYWNNDDIKKEWEKYIENNKKLEGIVYSKITLDQWKILHQYHKDIEDKNNLKKTLNQLHEEKSVLLKQKTVIQETLINIKENLSIIQTNIYLLNQRKKLHEKEECPLCLQLIHSIPVYTQKDNDLLTQKEIDSLARISHLEKNLTDVIHALGKLEQNFINHTDEINCIDVNINNYTDELNNIPESFKSFSFKEVEGLYKKELAKQQEQIFLQEQIIAQNYLKDRYDKYEVSSTLLRDIINSISSLMNTPVIEELFEIKISFYDDIFNGLKNVVIEKELALEKFKKLENTLKYAQLEIEQLEKTRSIYMKELIDMESKIKHIKQGIELQKNAMQKISVLDINIDDELDTLRKELYRCREEERIKNSEYKEISLKYKEKNIELKIVSDKLDNIENQYNLLSNKNIDFLYDYENIRQKKQEIGEQFSSLQTSYDSLLTKQGYIKAKQELYLQKKEKISFLELETEKLLEDFLLLEEINQLIGSSDGKKFKTFAQAITLDQVIALANDYLRYMQDRYVLEREVSNTLNNEQLNFVVIDQLQGDFIRSIETLSGGEKFLISLSLALGLSGLASEKIKVESFFLDEGFGTLDEESLQLVLDALTSLKGIGKTVGLISHVELLKDRIDTKIEIIPIGNGYSKIQGVGVVCHDNKKNIKLKELF